MTNPAKRKGDRAELEVQGLLRDLLGVSARRALGAGRKDDVGDIGGLENTVIQVANHRDLNAALRLKLPETIRQQKQAGALFAALFLRRVGGGYVVCMTVEQFATLWREAQPIAPPARKSKPKPSPHLEKFLAIKFPKTPDDAYKPFE